MWSVNVISVQVKYETAAPAHFVVVLYLSIAIEKLCFSLILRDGPTYHSAMRQDRINCFPLSKSKNSG